MGEKQEPVVLLDELNHGGPRIEVVYLPPPQGENVLEKLKQTAAQVQLLIREPPFEEKGADG